MLPQLPLRLPTTAVDVDAGSAPMQPVARLWLRARPVIQPVAAERRSIAQLHSKEALRAARRALKSRRDACRVERAEERELARLQQRDEAAELARALAAAVAMAAGSACAACGERDACMLELKCGHACLCRECWEADAAGPGAAARRPCAQCGGALERGHAIQLFRA